MKNAQIDRNHDPFEFLGSTWKNSPLSLPLFRRLLEFVSKQDFDSNENHEIVEGLAIGFGLSSDKLRTCLMALRNPK